VLHGNREGEVENAVLKWMRWEGFCYVILSFGYLSPLVENIFLFQIGKGDSAAVFLVFHEEKTEKG